MKQSETWPVMSARKLHGKVQLRYLWQFLVPGSDGVYDVDMMMLAQGCTFPGIKFEQKDYNVGGQVRYYLGKAERGGPVEANFIEVEGGKVDRFFRRWADIVDPVTVDLVGLIKPLVNLQGSVQGVSSLSGSGVLGASRSRTAVGFGFLDGYSRTALVRFMKRDGAVGHEFILRGLKLQSFATGALALEASGAAVVKATMVCDEVVRRY